MGYDLHGRGGYFGVDILDWRPCVETAQTWGWKPSGTLLPYGPPEAQGDPGSDWTWDGNYFSNDFQEVTDRDARALGEALLRGVTPLEAREREMPSRWPDDWLHSVRRFADRALKGGFHIG